uniref:UvrD-helicase domain-containing protein n=1 Tax=Candidatus Magnetaquicoccus inordinatus TaxID=2496818 RepID=UPI00102C65B9
MNQADSLHALEHLQTNQDAARPEPPLTSMQKSVIEHEDGALLVHAGPGSDKTRILAARVRRLLHEVPGHFHVLVLTVTNIAAKELKEHLADLGKESRRLSIETVHAFCREMLAQRGKPVGITGAPLVVELQKDRRQILLEAIHQNPLLAPQLKYPQQGKSAEQILDQWLFDISRLKTQPSTLAKSDDDLLARRVLDAYDSALRAKGAYDFDDMLVLACRLMREQPIIADFYRRLYRFISIDEAQELNEAQYAVLTTLCGGSLRNVLMIGNPKQTFSPSGNPIPEYMRRFRDQFAAETIDLAENLYAATADTDKAKSSSSPINPSIDGASRNMAVADLDRQPDVLQSLKRDIARQRQQAKLRPDNFLPALATSLNNLGIQLHALGRREEALAATEEAVTICKQL